MDPVASPGVEPPWNGAVVSAPLTLFSVRKHNYNCDVREKPVNGGPGLDLVFHAPL